MPHAEPNSPPNLAQKIKQQHKNEAIKLYILTRLSIPSHENQENQETLPACILATLPYIAHIPSMQPLNDGSWELLVRKTDLPLLRHVVQRHLPFATLIDEAYHPREPTDADVSCWGPRAARKLAGFWFRMRASRVIGERVGVVADFYQDLLDSSGWTAYDFA
ncbi:hypothetical protein IFM51744_04981 [Aspergillus udagawae]|nr:hypothetical protein IFM51744_04981 [Aspergillus udagawae]